MENKKIFVIDSNVILNDPHCIYGFANNDVYVPYAVLEEIDTFKKKNNSLGFSAREFARTIDNLREKGSLQKGVELKTGGRFKVVPNNVENSRRAIDDEVNDEVILNTAKTLNEKEDQEVVLVTKDTLLRVKADSIGLCSENYKNEEAEDKTLFDEVDEYYTPKSAPPNLVDNLIEDGVVPYHNISDDINLHDNEFFVLKDSQSGSPVLAYKNDRYIYRINPESQDAFGVNPKNKEQSFALNALLDDSVKLVCLSGRSGTGKTFCSLAAGLQKVANEEKYEQVLVTKSVMSVGNEIGFLPGDLRDKMDPWLAPYYDNITQIYENPHEDMKGKKGFESMEEQDFIDIQSIAHIRGRSIPNSFVVVDECFPFEQKIVTEDGNRQIGSICNKKSPPKVLSYNEKTDSFEYKEVSKTISHLNERKLLEVKFGGRKVKCTSEHPFLVHNKGWKKAEELSEGDPLLCHSSTNKTKKILNDDQRQIVLGSFLGDGGFNGKKLKENTSRMAIVHGKGQEDYCKWKCKIMRGSDSFVSKIEKNGVSNKEAYKFNSTSFYEKNSFPTPKKECPQWVLNEIDKRGWAISFMDDGSVDKNSAGKVNSIDFHFSNFSKKSLNKIARKMEKDFDIDVSVCGYKRKTKLGSEEKIYRKIALNLEASQKFLKKVSQYLHKDFKYKANDSCNEIGKYNWSDNEDRKSVLVVDDVNSLDEREKVYDITVEDNHNFILASSQSKTDEGADCATSCGPVVHNCQNLSALEVKTIATRIAEDSKLIMIGDPEQIDNPYLDQYSNGLSHIIDKFRGESIFAHVNLRKGERSKLADRAAELL